jgi:hypothetical protein
MPSGFYELEGGSQPGLPTGDFIRLWKDNSDNSPKILFPDGRNIKLSDINSEEEIEIIKPNDLILIYDSVANTFRKIKGSNISPQSVQTRFVTYDEDDFISTLNSGKLGWTATINGSGATITSSSFGQNGTLRALGVFACSTGTTATGRSTLNRGVNTFTFGYCSFIQTWRLALSELSDSTNRFRVDVGFIDVTAAGEQTDGVYFRYSDLNSGGNWECVTRENSVETVVDSGVPATDTSFNIFKIEVNESGDEANFFINDTLVGTITSNIPKTPGRETGIGAKIEKSVGALARILYIDYFSQKGIWSNGR